MYWTLTKTGYRWYDPIENQFDDRLEPPKGEKENKGMVQYSQLFLKSIINTVPVEMVQNAEVLMKFPLAKIERILNSTEMKPHEVEKIIAQLKKAETSKLTYMAKKIAVFNYLFSGDNAYVNKVGNTFLLIYRNYLTDLWDTSIIMVHNDADFHLLCNLKLSDFKINHSDNSCKIRQKIKDILSKQ